MAGYLAFGQPCGRSYQPCGRMGRDSQRYGGLFAPTMDMWPGQNIIRCNGNPSCSTGAVGQQQTGKNPALASLLDDILSELFSPVEKKDTSSSDAKKCCGSYGTKRKVWSEVIQLPPGFTPRNIEDVTVKDDKVTVKLVKISMDHLGRHSVMAVRQIRIPEDVQPRTMKLVLLDNSRISVHGFKKVARDEKKAGSPPEGQELEVEVETTQKKIHDENTEKPTDVEETFEVIEKVEPAEDDIKDPQSCPSGDCDPECMCEDAIDTEGKSCCARPEECCAQGECLCECENSQIAESCPTKLDACCAESECECGISQLAEATVEGETTQRKFTEGITTDTTECFERVLSLEPFQPEEIKLKLSGSELFIDAVHRDEDDGNVSSFEMHRSVTIPRGVDLDQLKSRVGDDGKLVISAPYQTQTPRERVLDIELA